MSSVLFGSAARSTSKHLVEFRAGKMVKKDKIVHSDKRKGLVYVYQADDSLMHFCWKDRTTGVIEEDLIIFPDDVVFKKVKNCPNGRVYVLRFKSNNRLFFFWMQEPKADKDDEYCSKVNEFLNNPPVPGAQRSSSSTPNALLSGSDLSTLQNSDLGNLIGNISQHQLMQLLGSGMPNLASLLTSPNASGGRSSSSTTTSTTGSSTTTSTTASSTSSTTATATTTTSSATTASTASSEIQLSDLQSILNGMSVPNASTQVDLSSVMTAEALKPILSNEEFVKQLKPFLPDTGKDLPPAEQLRGTVTSPQFQQAVNLFTTALQSGQLGPLINQFGLGEEAVTAASGSDMEAFIKALGKKNDSNKEKETEAGNKDQDKDQDDAMALD